ncbi:MAG TPA: flagellar biosynthetic protein FliO [Blastocatellia bacterium]|nr:flagellar biosynthetic protein FliO [Blastocatellia bacterium]
MSKFILKTSSLISAAFLVALISLSLTSNAAAQDQRRTLMDDNKPAEQSDAKSSNNSTKQSGSTSSTADPAQTGKDKPSIVGSGLGQQSTSAPAKSSWPQQAPGSFELIYRPLGATLLICAFAIGFLKIYRRYAGGKGEKDAPLASILATLPLGDKRSLAVVKVGHEVLVLGNTPNAITLLTQMTEDLHPLSEPQSVRAPRQKAQAVQPIEDFTKNLKEEMERKAQNRSTGEPQFARVRQSLLGIQ